MATPKNNDKRDLRLNLADLEQLSTHQLAELMANFVLLLRRLPDVPFGELAQLPTERQEQKGSNTGDDLVSKARERVNGHSEPVWWAGKDKQQ